MQSEPVEHMLDTLPLTRTERLQWTGIYQRLLRLEGETSNPIEIENKFRETLTRALIKVGRIADESNEQHN